MNTVAPPPPLSQSQCSLWDGPLEILVGRGILSTPFTPVPSIHASFALDIGSLLTSLGRSQAGGGG